MPYTTVTRAALRGLLQARYQADPFWSATEANDALNEAMRQFNLFTGFWRGDVTVTTSANTPFIILPASMTYRTRVYRSGRALTRKSIVELFRSRRNWRTETTTSGGDVPTAIREWAPVGLAMIAVWPQTVAAGTSLTVDAVKITPVLSADGSLLDLGDEEQGILLDEALWILAFKRPSLLEQMRPRHQAFLAACLERNDQLRASSYFRSQLGLDQEQRLEPTRHTTSPEEAA